MITTKLDTASLSLWESEAYKLDSVTAEQLLEYLQSRFRILEAVESTGNFVSTSKVVKEQSKKKIHKGLYRLRPREKLSATTANGHTRFINVRNF